MAGETSKRIGDFGEAFLETFFDHFNWQQLGDGNVDIDCIYHEHTTPTGGDRRTHGLDFVYCYDNPYDDSVKEVVLIEGKALSWGRNNSRGERVLTSERTLSNKIKLFTSTLQEKIVCAQNSQVFRETYGLEGVKYNVSGMIFYYVRDGFFTDEVLGSVLSQTRVKRDIADAKIMLMANNLLSDYASVFNFLGRYSNNFQDAFDFYMGLKSKGDI